MTGTDDMELLEREPSLACLAGYAAEARRGEGRLVLLGSEAGWEDGARRTVRQPRRRTGAARPGRRSRRAGRRALDLWRAAGDRLREGDTMRQLCCTLWHLCRGQEAESAADRAVEVLESLPPGVELAQAYANLATRTG